MSQITSERVERACQRLVSANKPVSFTAVAAIAKIGRATLYRNAELRAIIEEHRAYGPAAVTFSQLKDDIARLQTSLEAVAAKVRHHDDQLRRLLGEKRQRSSRRD